MRSLPLVVGSLAALAVQACENSTGEETKLQRRGNCLFPERRHESDNDLVYNVQTGRYYRDYYRPSYNNYPRYPRQQSMFYNRDPYRHYTGSRPYGGGGGLWNYNHGRQNYGYGYGNNYGRQSYGYGYDYPQRRYYHPRPQYRDDYYYDDGYN